MLAIHERTGSSVSDSYREKLNSLGFGKLKGSTRKRKVVDERTGGYAGFHRDHWDGRVDATVVASPTTTVNPSLKAVRND